MSFGQESVSDTAAIYTSVGAGSPSVTGVAVRHFPCPPGEFLNIMGLKFTDLMYFDGDVDIRDGITRAAGSNAVTYNDGYMVKIPDASGTSYVVVWVEHHNRGKANAMKRVYLMRHTAVWPGP